MHLASALRSTRTMLTLGVSRDPLFFDLGRREEAREAYDL